MNCSIIIGRLGQDPEVRFTDIGTPVCSLSVAVSKRSNKSEADFIPVVAWRNLAENASKYLVKGRRIGVKGYLEIQKYNDHDGVKRVVMKLIATEIEYLDSPNDSSTPKIMKYDDEHFPEEEIPV